MTARVVLLKRLTSAQRLVGTSAAVGLVAEAIRIVTLNPAPLEAGAERLQVLEDAVVAAESVADSQRAIESIDRWMVDEGLRNLPDPRFRARREPAIEWPEEVRDRLKIARANRATALNVLGDRLDALRVGAT